MDTPSQRVLRFIADWHGRWTEAKESERTDAWDAAIDSLLEEHFVSGAACPSTGFTEESPEHAPGKERIIEKSEVGSTAIVRTERASLFFEYELTRANDGWKIRNLRRASRKFPPIGGSPPLIAHEDRQELLQRARPDASLRALSAGTEPNCDGLFADRSVTVRGKTISIEVREIGTLRTTSGVLAVHDFFYADGRSVVPLARRIAAGAYPVEVAYAVELGVPIAIRVRLSERQARTWHPADVPGGGYVVGTDGGSLTIFDLDAFVQLDEHAKEQLNEASFVDPGEGARMMPILEEDRGVSVASGYGDGAYPCYWGADDEGGITSLVVDFMVLAEPKTATARVDLDTLSDPITSQAGVLLDAAIPEAGAIVLGVRGDAFVEARVLDGRGTVIADTARAGYQLRAGRREYRLSYDPRAEPVALDVSVDGGYRNP